MQLTWPQAFKVWWSFLWRHVALMVPVLFTFILVGVALTLALKVNTGPGGNPQIPLWVSALVYLVMIPSGALVQVAALKWALKTEWSDFRLTVTPTEPRPEA